MNTLTSEQLSVILTSKIDLNTIAKMTKDQLLIIYDYLHNNQCNNSNNDSTENNNNNIISNSENNKCITKLYHSNGNIKKEYFIDINTNKKEGNYKEWHSNGQLSEETQYINGKIEGNYKEWYSNGQLCAASE